MAMDGGINRQSASYRQGLVLGLTMAEIMLLLVFCLLIGMGTLLAARDADNAKLEKMLITQGGAIKENNKLRSIVKAQDEIVEENAKLRAAASAQDRVIEDNTKLKDELKAQGVTIEELQGALQNSASIDPVIVEWLHRHEEVYSNLKNVASGADDDDEDWREFALAKDLLASAKNSGTDVHQVLEDWKALSLHRIDANKALSDAEIAEQVARGFGKSGEAVTVGGIANVVERGLRQPETPSGRWPPMISLSEADGYYFESGSAELTEEFRTKLRESIPDQILKIIKEFDVDVIEVIGHTDGKPHGQHQSNLDRSLVSVLRGSARIGDLVTADNPGLGLARAVSVVTELLRSEKLKDYRLIPLSGAQLVNVDESLALSEIPGDVRERRRIEIRLRRHDVRGRREGLTDTTP